MLRCTVERELSCTADAAFTCLTDFENASSWMIEEGTMSKSFKLTCSGPMRAGSTYVDHTKLGDMQGEVLAWEDGRLVVFRQTLTRLGITWVQGTHTYEMFPRDAGCLVRWTGEMVFRGPFWLAQSSSGETCWSSEG